MNGAGKCQARYDFGDSRLKSGVTVFQLSQSLELLHRSRKILTARFYGTPVDFSREAAHLVVGHVHQMLVGIPFSMSHVFW